VDEADWRQLGETALSELSELGFDAATEVEVRRRLAGALAQQGAGAKAAIRAVLTGWPQLRSWLRDRTADPLRSARPGQGGAPVYVDDGSSDLLETLLRTDPSQADGDGDDVSDGYEGTHVGSDPMLADSDGPVKSVETILGSDTGWIFPDDDAAREPTDVGPPMAAPDEAAAAPQAPPSAPGPPQPPTAQPAPPPTRTVHARLEAPDAVQVEVPFTLIVGIAATPSRDVLAPAPMHVPTGAFALTVSLLLDGFRTSDGSSPVRTVFSSPEVPHPSVVVDLVAVNDPTYRAARSILAEYTIDGRPLGVATRSIQVLPDAPTPAARALAADRSPQRPPTVWALPSEGAPDLQITVARGNDEAGRRLVWSAHSPHDGVLVPAEPVTRRLDEAGAGDWARRVMRGVEQRKKAEDLAYYLRGVQKTVGKQVPQEIWAALESVAQVLRDPDTGAVRHPTVLFATAEPFIPWELAWVPQPWDPDRPALLGAQTQFGRWLHDDDSQIPAPAVRASVQDIAVVKGEYTGSARLPEAEEEADHLVRVYGARQVPAELAAVLACLEGRPEADLLHFAVHGKFDLTGTQDGIVMNDRSTLGSESILGVDTGRPRLAFLNACQVGQTQEMLGDTAGIVPSIISIGAQCVIAPLWKVDDAAARDFAERFYAELRAGGQVADFLARERARAAVADGAGSARSTVLAYLFFGHPRLTVTGLEEVTHGPVADR
jgi:hypothetical protein